MPPPLVGEALAFRRVFECKRFATICPADAVFCLTAEIDLGAKGEEIKNESFAKGSPTRGAVAAKPATERFNKEPADRLLPQPLIASGGPEGANGLEDLHQQHQQNDTDDHNVGLVAVVAVG